MLGKSNAIKEGVIQESDLIIPTLRILSVAPDGFLETSELIKRLEEIFNPQGKDAEVIIGRNDTYFSQKVRNIISHRDNQNNPISKGWVIYHSDRRGIEITDLGSNILLDFI